MKCNLYNVFAYGDAIVAMILTIVFEYYEKYYSNFHFATALEYSL